MSERVESFQLRNVLSAFVSSFLARRRRAFDRFVDRKKPAKLGHSLSHKNLFIFPTIRGFVFLAITATLWLLGTNYQNNLILALAFFMVSLFVLAIHITFLNLNRLYLRYADVSEVFAGEEAQLNFQLKKQARSPAEEIEFDWQEVLGAKTRPATSKANTTVIEVVEKSGEHLVSLYCPSRGVYELPRLRVQSLFPLGILRCWTWLNWDVKLVVFPKPVHGGLGTSAITSDDEGDGLHPVKGGEDFSGLESYIPGDSLRRVSWKTFAKGRGLYVKDFSESLSKEKWLDYDAVIADTLEERLSVLAFWVLHYYQENEHYGLKLPTSSIEPNSGYDHRTRCLNILATYS